MVNKIFSVLVGAAVLLAIIYGCETMVGRMYPSPTGTDFEQARVLDRLMNQLPRGTFAGLFLGYALASLIGGVITTLLSGRTEIIPAVVTGVVAMVVSVFNPYEAPHPLCLPRLFNITKATGKKDLRGRFYCLRSFTSTIHSVFARPCHRQNPLILSFFVLKEMVSSISK